MAQEGITQRKRAHGLFLGNHVISEGWKQLSGIDGRQQPPAERQTDLQPLFLCTHTGKYHKMCFWTPQLILCTFAYRCKFGPVIVFASSTKLKRLTEWFHSLHGLWDGNSKLYTATSFLLSLFQDPVLEESLENGKETSRFLLDWEECGTVLMAFAGVAHPSVLSPLKEECRLVNWLSLISPVQVPITAQTEKLATWAQSGQLWLSDESMFIWILKMDLTHAVTVF